MYQVEVIADSSGEWCGNALTFQTEELAAEYARDLFSRWTAVKEWRVVQMIVGWGRVTKEIVVKTASWT